MSVKGRFTMLRVSAIAILLFAPLLAQDALPEVEVLLGQGISQFDAHHYSEAIATFQRVLEINPAAAHWYLAQIYLAQYAPGLREPENAAIGQRAKAEFESLLQLNKENGAIMASIGCLSYQEAEVLDNLEDKDRK